MTLIKKAGKRVEERSQRPSKEARTTKRTATLTSRQSAYDIGAKTHDSRISRFPDAYHRPGSTKK
jgi:hypothetical protein